MKVGFYLSVQDSAVDTTVRAGYGFDCNLYYFSQNTMYLVVAAAVAVLIFIYVLCSRVLSAKAK